MIVSFLLSPGAKGAGLPQPELGRGLVIVPLPAIPLSGCSGKLQLLTSNKTKERMPIKARQIFISPSLFYRLKFCNRTKPGTNLLSADDRSLLAAHHKDFESLMHNTFFFKERLSPP